MKECIFLLNLCNVKMEILFLAQIVWQIEPNMKQVLQHRLTIYMESCKFCLQQEKQHARQTHKGSKHRQTSSNKMIQHIQGAFHMLVPARNGKEQC